MIQYKRIGQICSVLNGFAFKSENYVDSGLRIIRIANVQKGAIEDSQPVYYPLSTPNMDKYLLHEGDLLLSLTGNVGRVAILGREFLPAALNQRVACLRITDASVTIKYLFHILNSTKFENDCIQAANGVAQKNMSTEWLKQYEIPVYPVEIQENIVKELDKIQAVIQKRHKQISSFESLVKSQFIEMFGSLHDNRFNFPVGTVGQECTLKSGTSLPAEVENEGGNIPYVKVGDMVYNGSDKYVLESSHMVSEKTAGSGLFPPGTIIFPKRGGAIGTNKKRITTRPICADLNVMGVIPGERVSSQYLYSYFLAIDLGKLNNGSSVPQINNKDISPLKILIPPVEKQSEFTRFVEQTDKSKIPFEMEVAA